MHIAIIFLNNNIITYGFNYYNNNDISIHAEEDAINKLIKKISSNEIKRKKYKILIIRFKINSNNEYELLMSKPCIKCQLLLKNYSYLFKKIYWSVDNNLIDSFN